MSTLHAWLAQTPFTLTMSSGFFSFFAHAGMLAALENAQLKPARITGSSAGALVGGLFASGCRVADLKPRLFSLTKADFWDPRPGWGLLAGERFRELVADMAGVERIEQCPTPLALSVYDLASRETHVVEAGPLADTIVASCSVPGLFQPVRLNGRATLDGGVADRPGLAGTRPSDRIFYHHIVSRSPWRPPNAKSLQIPRRPNFTSLSLFGLPRSGPSKLDRGPAIFEAAQAATQTALSRPRSNRIAIHIAEIEKSL